jgi:hypothetical protein
MRLLLPWARSPVIPLFLSGLGAIAGSLACGACGASTGLGDELVVHEEPADAGGHATGPAKEPGPTSVEAGAPSAERPEAGVPSVPAPPSLGHYPRGALATAYGGYGTSGVAVYPPNPKSDTAPLAIVGAAWDAANCEGIGSVAFDAAHRLYAVCNPIVRSSGMAPSMVAVFDDGAGTGSAPSQVLSMDDRTMYYFSVFAEPSGAIEVVAQDFPDHGPAKVERYTTDGAQTGSITGPLLNPWGLGGDGRGHLYATNTGAAPVAAFTVDASGLHADGEIGEPADMGIVRGVAVDGAGRVYVAGDLSFVQNLVGRVVVYANRAIERVISGDQTGLSQPSAVAVDAAGRIYVADLAMVQIFGAQATGNMAPEVVMPGVGTTVAIAP